MKDTLDTQASGDTQAAGIRLTRLAGFDAVGLALVDLPGGETRPARSLVPLDAVAIGAELAVSPLGDGSGLMLILGVLDPPRPDRHVVEATTELVLRCGNASVTLTSDGKLTLRGAQVLSRAEGANRVQGAAVMLN